MKVIFVSNYFNHHQKPLCDAFFGMNDLEFNFISTSKMREDRKQMGYDKITIPSYVIHAENGEEAKTAKELITEADVIICGYPPKYLIEKRLKQNKLIFYYAERPLKKELSFIKKMKIRLAWKSRAPKRKRVYLLTASAYSTSDFHKIGVFKNTPYNRTFKWGYFPKTENEIDFSIKKKNTILWCGRLLSLKRPMDMLKALNNLKNKGYAFSLKIIGKGEEEERVNSYIKDNNLENFVQVCDFMSAEDVREEMKKSSIYLFTSNKEEGWGAVLNESMNSGCAVISSHMPGSVPYLIRNEENGLVYESENAEMLEEKLRYLFDNPEKQLTLGKAAYKTIIEKWNAEVAAKRFIILAKTILNSTPSPDLFPDGPCSVSYPITDEWKN